MSTFAVADGWEEDAGRYVGLRLPGEADPLFAVTGVTLLVQPGVAEAQRTAETQPAAHGAPRSPAGSPQTAVPGTVQAVSSEGRGTAVAGPASKRRFFGSRVLSADRYGGDFATVTREVLQHLAATPGVRLEVRLEISAVTDAGFPEDVVRTVGENATTLRFEQSGFEES